jgi:hypothetical protein
MGDRRCCCVGECIVLDDDFDRAPSTSLGSNWHEEAGDWETIGYPPNGWLHEKAGTTPGEEGTADAKVMCTLPTIRGGELQVQVSIVDPVIGDVFYIYLGCTTYHGAGGEWVRFTYTDTDEWLVTLSTGEFKTQTYHPPDPLSTTTPVVACLDSDGFLMGAIASSGDEYPWNDGDATAEGRYAGLGHDNADTGATFDDFVLTSLRTSTEDCTNCFCHCGALSARNNLQKTLQLTIYDASQRASCMNTATVAMTWEWNSGVPRWVSEIMHIDSQTDGSSEYAEFKWYLECGTHDPADPFAHFSLNWYPGYKDCCSGNDGGCDGVHLPIAASECTALKLRFGPFVLSVGELTCNACWDANDPDVSTVPPPPVWDPPLTGEYYIEITEAAP